jgi:hypothetical protein
LSGPLPASLPGDVARIGWDQRTEGAVEAAKRGSVRGEAVGGRTAARDGREGAEEGAGVRRGLSGPLAHGGTGESGEGWRGGGGGVAGGDGGPLLLPFPSPPRRVGVRARP